MDNLYSMVESEVSLTIMMYDLDVFSSNDESIVIFLVLQYHSSSQINNSENK